MSAKALVAHVVIAPFPCYGHILPAINLARALASRGPFISLVLSEHRISGPRSVASHLRSLQTSFPSSFRLISIPDPLSSCALSVAIDEGVDSVTAEMERSHLIRQPFQRLPEDLMAANDKIDPPGAPVCVISDAWLSWIPDITDELRIPWYVFYPSQPMILTTLFFLPDLQAQGRLPLKASPAPEDIAACDEEQLIRIPNMPPLRNLDCHGLLLDSYRDRQIHEKFVRNWITIIRKAAGVLINSFYELDTTSMDALQKPPLNPSNLDFLTVGPVHSFASACEVNSSSISRAAAAGVNSDVGQKESQCLQWLDAQLPASVLYVSFGSIALPSLSQIHELALGLESSEQPFLWTLRPPVGYQSFSQAASFDLSTVLPEGFLSRVQGRGLVIMGWAPQGLILSHRSTGAFLTHCGWNSTLESISMGVPTIGFPQFADQTPNCKLLMQKAKVGIELQTSGLGADGVVGRTEVERATRLMLTGEEGREMRRKAKEWRATAAKALGKGGSSDLNLELFIKKMEKLHSIKNL